MNQTLFDLQELYIIDSAGKESLVEANEKMVRHQRRLQPNVI